MHLTPRGPPSQNFVELDTGAKGYLDAPDLVSAFGKIETIDKAKALEIAATVIAQPTRAGPPIYRWAHCMRPPPFHI